MNASGYYPAGSDNAQAPWNQSEVPEEEFEVTCSQTLSKTTTVFTNNYIPGDSGVDYETDDEGHTYAIPYQEEHDTSETNWAEEYNYNDHYTPLELIELYKETLKEQLKSWEGMEETYASKREIRHIEHLIEECSNWIDDETEYIKA